MILSLNQINARTLFPDELAIGIFYKKQTSSMMKNLSISMSDEATAKLPLDSDAEFNVDTPCALENMRKLIIRGDYPLIRKEQGYRVVECIKQFRHALSHNDIIYLLLNMRICLSSVVLMTSTKVIENREIMYEALGGPCDLTRIIPKCEATEIC